MERAEALARELIIDSCVVYRVLSTDGALPTAIVWRVLPGAPRSAFLIDGQRLFISCEGGDVVLHDDGTIRLAVDELAPSSSGL